MLTGSLQQFLIGMFVTLFLTSIYGFYLAIAAYFLGDKGPFYDKRLTLNPLSHAGALGTLALLLFGVGWIKPIHIEADKFRQPRSASVLVVILSLGASALTATALVAVRSSILTFGPASISALTPFINMLFVTTVLCCCFNFIPIPPLIGGQALYALSPGLYATAQRYIRWTSLALAGLLLIASGSGLLATIRVQIIDFLR